MSGIPPFSSNPVATLNSRGSVRLFFYNVRDFGAKGDGTTNDTAAVNAAFSAAATLGGTIFFPPGTYLISSSITLLPNTVIRGAGMGATTITCPSSMSTPIFTIVMATGAGNNLHDWMICDLTMDGASGAATRGIQIDSSASAQITYYNNYMDHVTFQNFYIGVYHGANNANAGAMFNNTNVSYCSFITNSFGYVYLGTYCEWLDHTVFRNNTKCGLMTPGVFGAPAISGGTPGAGPSSASKITSVDVQNTVSDYTNGTENGILISASNSLFEHIFISDVSQIPMAISCSESGLDNRINDLAIYGSGGGLILNGIDKNTGGTVSNFVMFSTGAKTNWSGYVSRQAPFDIMSGSWKMSDGKTDNGLLGPVTIPPYAIYIGDSGPDNTGLVSFDNVTIDGSYATALYHGSPFSQAYLKLQFRNCDGINSTATWAAFNIPSGTAPTSPNDGDTWYDGTHLKFRIGGTTYQLDQQLTAGGAITGTTTNDNAASGIVGEIISSVIASGSATSLTSATPKNVTSISLTAGDWDITGVIDYVLTGATTSDFKSGSSSTSATFGAQDSFANLPIITTLLSDTVGHMIPTTRFSLASTTTVYLVAQCNFSAGTTAAYGTIRARRMR